MKGEDTLMACGPAPPCSNCACPFRPRACRGFHPGVGVMTIDANMELYNLFNTANFSIPVEPNDCA